jgi:hypothetical protein
MRDENVFYTVNLARGQKRDVSEVEQERALLEEHFDVNGWIAVATVDQTGVQKRPHTKFQSQLSLRFANGIRAGRDYLSMGALGSLTLGRGASQTRPRWALGPLKVSSNHALVRTPDALEIDTFYDDTRPLRGKPPLTLPLHRVAATWDIRGPLLKA